MIEIGKEYSLSITDVALPSAFGVARAGEMVVFVPGLVPGDKARIRIARLDKRFGYGEAVELEERSAFREKPVCAHFGECGGCDLQQLAYEKQLEIKQNHLLQALKRIGGIHLEEVDISDIVPSVDRFFYRNKVEFSFGEDAGGQTILGLNEPVSPLHPYTGAIMPVRECCLFSPAAAKMLPHVREFVERSGLKAHNPTSGKGSLKRLVMREAKQSGEILINIVSESGIAGQLAGLAQTLKEAMPQLASVYTTTGNRTTLLWGRPYLEETVCDLVLRIYPLSFFQPNPRTAEELYKTIIPEAGISRNEHVAGLYCGSGAIELCLARRVKEVRGIDSSKDSIACAKENAAANGLENCSFFRGRAERAGVHCPPDRRDVVIIDPPRSGITKEALRAIVEMRPRKLIYISCNPSTFARDLRSLAQEYEPKRIIPFDFFPHTGHFEVLSLLERP